MITEGGLIKGLHRVDNLDRQMFKSPKLSMGGRSVGQMDKIFKE